MLLLLLLLLLLRPVKAVVVVVVVLVVVINFEYHHLYIKGEDIISFVGYYLDNIISNVVIFFDLIVWVN